MLADGVKLPASSSPWRWNYLLWLVCSCCLAGVGDLTRTQEISCYPPCLLPPILSPVCLVCAGRVFITRDDQEEDSVGHCHKLEHQQWMCYLMHSFRQMRNQNINSQFTFTTSPFPPSPRRHCHWWIANCAISGVAILTSFIYRDLFSASGITK